MNLQDKYNSLLQILKELGGVVVAYSGGVDSTFLLKAAVDTLGAENVLACISVGPVEPEGQFERALKVAKSIGANLKAIEADELSDPNFTANKADRCFHCKSHLCRILLHIAEEQGFKHVVFGTNYDDLDENLRRHDARYPTADQLRSVTWQGRSGTWGKPANSIIGVGKDSEASESIIALLDEPDSRPIYFGVWGGSCDLAQALWKIKETRSVSEVEQLLAKVRVYLITLQDGTGQWLLDTFPKLFVISSRNTYKGMFGSADLTWVNTNIRNDHGILGAVYPTIAMGTKPGVKEGDSPSFLYLVSAVRGLNDPEQPNQPSWGGQFVRVDPARNHWTDHPSGGKTVRRWSEYFDNDFAARMDWCVKSYEEANHPPVVVLGHEADLKVRSGAMVKLSAQGTSDPDGDELEYRWWQYREAGSYDGTIEIRDAGKQDASFTVPGDAGKGKTVHIICEVTDTGTPQLTRYQRVVVEIE